MIEEENAVHMVFQIFISLAEYDPNEIYCYVDKIKQAIDDMGEMGFAGVQVLVGLSRGDEVSSIKLASSAPATNE